MNRKFILRSDKTRTKVQESLSQHIIALPDTEAWDVVISKHKEGHTGEQRAFAHVLFGIFSNETGFTKDEIKMLVKKEAWGSHEIEIAGKTMEVVKSTSGVKKDEYSELIEACYRLASEAGIVLPNPYWRK